MEQEPKVAIIMGSQSDLPVVEEAAAVLERFGVPFETRVLSAHRSPDAVGEFARTARDRGLCVLIAVAGKAAHLAGVLAAGTTLPVIGVPVPGDGLGGMDALLSTVQMPSGVPVACMGLGKSGARNAAVLAVQILAVGDSDLRGALESYRQELRQKVEAQDAEVQQRLKQRREQR